ncbi:MAG: hypothetical protein V3V46_03135 [Anaerolineales bacterium]
MPLAALSELSDYVNNTGPLLMEHNSVECLSSHTYAERPIALWWEGERLNIVEIVARWRIPGGRRFRVQAENNQVFELCYIELQDEWQVSLL